MEFDTNHALIVTIVKKGWGDEVIRASQRAGAEGATVLYARGVGVHEQAKLFGMAIQPEKEVVLSIVARDKAEAVLAGIVGDLEIHKPGTGLSFVVPIEKLLGGVHL